MWFRTVLVFAKIHSYLYKKFAKDKSDIAGLIAYKLCPDFLNRVKKPGITVMVTGTNGKTSTMHLISQMLRNAGLKTEYTDWGANLMAGHILTMLDCVTFTNKPKVDACVLETDEMMMATSLPMFKADYVLITNLCRDSIRRNAYPDYIYGKMKKGLDNYTDSTVILHANDPLSLTLGENNKRIYIGTEKIYDHSAYAGFSNEFMICPVCNSEVEYDFRHYRHVGHFRCPNCGFTNPEAKYVWQGLDGDKLILNGDRYHVISEDIFNLYNEIMIIGLFRELGFEPSEIDALLKTVHIHETREGFDSYKGIDIYRKCGKGQNGTAPSIVFESIMKNKNKKELVLIMDAEIGRGAQATITWLYDNDFELLNDDSVNKIIITGTDTLDYRLRLLLAGVPEEKLVVCDDYKEAHKYLTLDDSDIYLIVDIDYSRWGIEVVDNIKKRLDEEK